MLFISIIVGLFGIVLLIRTFLRYHPYFDLITNYDQYILLLWYDKDGGKTYVGQVLVIIKNFLNIKV